MVFLTVIPSTLSMELLCKGAKKLGPGQESKPPPLQSHEKQARDLNSIYTRNADQIKYGKFPGENQFESGESTPFLN